MDQVTQLQRLESAAWETAASRSLYSTPDIPGFPWFTTVQSEGSDADGDASPVRRRHVVPYDFTFKVFVKGRWVGRHLLDVYASEFPHHSRRYYEACVRHGKLQCVRKKTREVGNQRRRELKRGVETPRDARDEVPLASDIDTPLAHGDVVLHTVHRHEIPVTVGVTGTDPVRLVAVRIRRYGLLCLEKPAGVPTHSSGRYQMNTLLAMLEYVLAPKRLAHWLFQDDPLLQHLVDTRALTQAEKMELFDYYRAEACEAHSVVSGDGDDGGSAAVTCRCTGRAACETVALAKTPRPCFRLDKVTSGILLLGVSQRATQQVSQALMEKTLAMEQAVRAATDAPRETHKESLRRLPAQTVELRKHYLARTVGSAFAPAEEDGDVVEIDAEAARTWFPAQPFTPNDSTTTVVGTYPHALLTAASVPVQGISALQASAVTRQPSDATESIAARQCAATLCQRIASYRQKSTPSSESASASLSALPGESLVHCVPLTGRLHQIRLHLLALGAPIVGDITTATTPTTTTTTTVKGSSTVVNVIWYDPQQLPQGYRTFLAEQGAQGSSSQDAMLHEGNDDDDNGDEDDDEQTPTACGLGLSSLCYECAKKLPLSTIHEDAASSAICLHAWEYEINRHVLRGAAVASAAAHDDAVEEDEEEVECDGENASLVRYCFRRGDMIVFKVPPPSWAETPQL